CGWSLEPDLGIRREMRISPISEQPSIRWGMIGCGAVTEVKSGPALYTANGSTLIAVASRTLLSAQDYATRHRIPLFYENVDDLISSKEVDAIYVATPPEVIKSWR